MIRLYLTQREYDALLEAQGGKCCVRGCGATEDLIAEHFDTQCAEARQARSADVRALPQGEDAEGCEGDREGKRLNGKTMSQHQRRKKFGSRLKGRGFDKRE